MTEARVLEEVERRFLLELEARGVRFLVIGMTAAVLQGARGATEDIDLWFERLDDPLIGDAVRAVGGLYVSGSFGMQPPRRGGALGDRFDVVTHVDGARSFEEEAREAVAFSLEGVPLRLLPIRRILASKRASSRPKDKAQIPALEEAIAVLDDEREPEP